MELVQVLLTTVVSVAFLFLLTKIMGNRQIAQLTMFEYIVGITIGSIAAELATSSFSDVLKPAVAIIVYSGLGILLSVLTNKSIKARRFITGETLILIDDGKIYLNNLKKAKLDSSEMFTQLRCKGIFDINDVQTAIFEANGKISVLAKSSKRPMQASDIGFTPPSEKLVVNVILDGNVMIENLAFTGNDAKWLEKKLKEKNITKISDVFLATCDCNNNVCVFKKNNDTLSNDLFE